MQRGTFGAGQRQEFAKTSRPVNLNWNPLVSKNLVPVFNARLPNTTIIW
jgi:hypothetical protein